MYTKAEFGKELEKQLQQGSNIIQLARWAHEIYLDKCDGFEENSLSDCIMKIIMMEEGPEFEYTKEELLKMAQNLQKGKV